MKKSWGSYNYEGVPSYVLVQKLEALKSDMKKWNEDFFGNVGTHKNERWGGGV